MQLVWLSALFFLTAVPLAAFATPIAPWDDMQIKHAWHAVPAGWESLGYPSAGTTIDIDIALKPDRESAVIDALSEISDPKHPRYRAFLSKEQLDELVKPSPDSLKLVSAWLTYHGIRPSSISTMHGGNGLTVTDVPLPQVNQLLGASYRLYRNTRTNETIVRTVGYLLPAVLHTHIQTVTPTTCFPSMQVTLQTPHRRSFGPALLPAPAASGKLGTRLQPIPPPPDVVPTNLRWMYGTIQYEPLPFRTRRNRFGVVGNTYQNLDDLTDFMLDFREGSTDASVTLVYVDDNLGELDETTSVAIQYASAMSYPYPIFYYGTNISDTSLVRFLDLLLAEPVVIPTLSISYNYFIEPVVPPHLADLVCHKLAQLGSRGSSVLVASGNSGVGPEDEADCKDEEGNVKFVVEFPSSCPYVTSVGGTQYIIQEVADGHSGGGFSTHHPRPSYQDKAVLDFFREFGDEFSGSYNDTGRGYPDISAYSAGCAIVFNRHHDVSRGTACAVATAAGVFSLLNGFLISQRRKPLGFLNPWLYGPGSFGLADISGGSNPGCGTEGFSAVNGWDPVTGLGTPNFGLLLYSIPPDSERPDFIPPPAPPPPSPSPSP